MNVGRQEVEETGQCVEHSQVEGEGERQSNLQPSSGGRGTTQIFD